MRNLVFVLVAFVASSLLAQTYTWVGGETGSWNDAASFEPNGKPGAADTVVLPVSTVKLNAFDDDEWAAVNAIGRIQPSVDSNNADISSILVVDVGDKDRDCNFAFTYKANGGRNAGRMVKKGSGALNFKSKRDEYRIVSESAQRFDYYANYDIVEGTIALSQEIDESTQYMLGDVAISNNATLVTLATTKKVYAYTYVRDLWGESGAVITNTAPFSETDYQVFYPCGPNVSEFAGRICHPVRWIGAGKVHLTGEESTIKSFHMFGNSNRGFDSNHVGVKKFGLVGGKSSVGEASTIVSRDTGGAFLYLGGGEETDKSLEVRTEHPAFLSGGDHGGLVWKGQWQAYESAKNYRLVICGDGPNPNVMKGSILRTFFIRKQGKGIWRIEDSPKGLATDYQMLGAWGIDEGTLQFTSLAEKGFVSSLGMATQLYKDYGGVREEANRVPYAFVLGGDSSEGTLEYVGDKDEFCSDRPLWLYGDGAFANNGQHKIRFSGVSSVAEGENPVSRGVKFTLKGESMAENEILDITDSSERPVSVVKEGSGTWVLGGEQSFRGTLSVKGGKLIIRRPETYSWHRWTVTSKVGTGSDYNLYFELQEFGLFDEDGMRKNLDLAYIDDYAALKPGEVAFGTDKIPYTSAGSIAKLFDDKKTDPGWRGILRSANATSGTETPEKDKPLSWMPIVMRLPEGAGEITSYDIVHYQASTHVRSVASYFVDGSVDGVHWDRLSTVDPVGSVGSNDWEFKAVDFGSGGEGNKVHERGRSIASAPVSLPNVLNKVKSVSVAAGAELVCEGNITISSLELDATLGGGTIKGCNFAESGTLELANLPARRDFAGAGIDIADCRGVDNIRNWTLKVDGKANSLYKLNVAGGKRIVVVKGGLRIVVR